MQLRVIWNLVLQPDSEGPTLISHAAWRSRATPEVVPSHLRGAQSSFDLILGRVAGCYILIMLTASRLCQGMSEIIKGRMERPGVSISDGDLRYHRNSQQTPVARPFHTRGTGSLRGRI